MPRAYAGCGMSDPSPLEAKAATPIKSARTTQALKRQTWHLEHSRPGEGLATQPGGPVNWHEMEDDEYDETWGALCDFLLWALPHWGFTSEQFPHQCWWLHNDVIEEVTAWWGVWQSHVRNPAAPIHSQMEFQAMTFQLKQRLEQSYRGRCRHEHQPTPAIVVTLPM